MPRLLAACAVLLFAAPVFAADDYPHVVIENKKLKFTLYEADAAKGFYRGTRFDHAGVFGQVEFAGHTLFGPWLGKHDPTHYASIVGPCDEFGTDSPLGYADAKVGETFLKIGVGELEKPKEAKYSFATPYKVVTPLKWEKAEETEKGSDGEMVLRTWATAQKANGYGYSYRKWLSVGPSLIGPKIEIGHVLQNTGEKRIVTDVYNHNFFNVDGDPVGPNYSFAFPFEPKANDLKGKFGELVELKDKELRFKDKIPNGIDVMATLTGYDSKDRTFEMRHAPSGVTVLVRHSHEFAKFNVWGVTTTICPEPYLAIDLKPGETMKWDITYTFAHDPPKKK